ncbi:MAG: Arc family DNA binding domain-containing protein [Candidatus Eisenbacteria bacterium]|nr:Arc family DNA binding domain-containing protein [Candidatus Eisenbacteria bacterium]
MAERKKFLLRMSPDLWEELNRWAAREFRSVNGQIEFLLRRAVDERSSGKKDTEGGEGENR